MAAREELESWFRRCDAVLAEEEARLEELKEGVQWGEITHDEAEIALQAFHNRIVPDIKGEDL